MSPRQAKLFATIMGMCYTIDNALEVLSLLGADDAIGTDPDAHSELFHRLDKGSNDYKVVAALLLPESEREAFISKECFNGVKALEYMEKVKAKKRRKKNINRAKMVPVG